MCWKRSAESAIPIGNCTIPIGIILRYVDEYLDDHISKFSYIAVQFSHSGVSDSLRPHELQHARLPCPSPVPGACSNSCLLSW